MKGVGLVISALLVSTALFSQTGNSEALAYYNQGMHNVYIKNYKKAVIDFTEAISHDPVFIQAWENRGVAKYYLEDYDGAISDYNRALEINPEDYKTYGRRGYARFKNADLPGAISDMNKAVEGILNNAGYVNTRGQAKYYLHDYEGAISDFDKVIRFWSGDRKARSEAFYWRGVTRIDIGQKESGCLDLQKSSKLGFHVANDLYDICCN